MTVFIISALILIVVALFMIVPTLLKKNQPITDDYDAMNVSIAKDRLKEIRQQLDAGEITQEAYQQLHDELEANLALDLENSKTSAEAEVQENKLPVPLITAILLPVLAVVLYSQLGDFSAVTGKAAQSVEIPAGENRQQMSIEEAIAKLQLRLQQEPDNADGWYMLAKTYMTTQQYPQAAAAYKSTIDLVGDDPQLLLRYADALARYESELAHYRHDLERYAVSLSLGWGEYDHWYGAGWYAPNWPYRRLRPYYAEPLPPRPPSYADELGKLKAESCARDCGCQPKYDACFLGCGGSRILEERCFANCPPGDN